MWDLNRGARYYLAGPMTGIPQFNFPAFFAAAQALRQRGFTIVSPAELDEDATRDAALASPDGAMPSTGELGGRTWGDILARDVKVVADRCDGIIFLPRWFESRGARLEAYVGILCGHVFGRYDPEHKTAHRYATTSVRRHLARELLNGK